MISSYIGSADRLSGGQRFDAGTIISDDSVMGDALSTACFVSGLDEGMKLAEKIWC